MSVEGGCCCQEMSNVRIDHQTGSIALQLKTQGHIHRSPLFYKCSSYIAHPTIASFSPAEADCLISQSGADACCWCPPSCAPAACLPVQWGWVAAVAVAAVAAAACLRPAPAGSWCAGSAAASPAAWRPSGPPGRPPASASIAAGNHYTPFGNFNVCMFRASPDSHHKRIVARLGATT